MSRQFFEIDEEFICENCNRKIERLGYSCRNHCNYCLHSKHVDKNPGDREEECHGLLEPIGIETDSKKGYVIVFKCKKCGQIRKNKTAKDDCMDEIIKLSVNEAQTKGT
ncbi:MAG: RNHCP domain-containing protein [Oscillospiraceae bacterium]|nr:RNHCP domain-containing protein [Oscillospiraceae bacterium]